MMHPSSIHPCVYVAQAQTMHACGCGKCVPDAASDIQMARGLALLTFPASRTPAPVASSAIIGAPRVRTGVRRPSTGTPGARTYTAEARQQEAANVLAASADDTHGQIDGSNGVVLQLVPSIQSITLFRCSPPANAARLPPAVAATTITHTIDASIDVKSHMGSFGFDLHGNHVQPRIVSSTSFLRTS